MESGTREKARNVLKRILAAASYDVEEVGDPLDLSAVGSDDALVVLCSDDPETIENFDSMIYRLRTGEDDWICRKLLFTLDSAVQTEDCIRWGPDEFVRYAGRAALADVLGQSLILDLPLPARTARRGQIEASPVPVEEEPQDGPELPHLPVQVAEKRACGIAGVHGKAKCRFIPYWNYRYVSTGEREVKDRLVSFDAEGAGAINAINGLKMEINPDDIERGPVPFGSEIVSTRLVREDVEEQLVRDVVDRLTQRIRFRYEKGDAIFYEEKTLKPDRSNITVDLETVYVPVWQVRGGSKIVEVNGFTGEVLSMPMDEGVELL
ncbi:hypothetical protein FGW20_05270 [Methanoculleus sp. FWC-SCC3]|uniref:Uncharacterized protein n=1 Tax=Methanoculleus methanifontis TaxID=2584086 RepID=A0ABT8M0A8_9EURY|nr:hypothetical protein [Methanoculleus sp. FWC-SCC3]MDN7012460.1 hypothetical protein [Methanoculleus sp. FWC-SCC3]